jgi:hypothetical protein
MKKILLFVIFAFLAITTIITTYTPINSVAAEPTATLSDFNPLGGKGIKCLYSYKDKNLKGFENCNTDTGLLNRVEKLMYLLAPAFAVIGIMLGGYKMMQDGYDAKGEGMKTIRGSIVGLVIVLSAYFIRNLTYTFFNSTFTDEKLEINNKVVEVVVNLLREIAYNVLVPIGSPIAVGFVIWGGYQLITAGGNQKKIDAGTATIRNAIIGFLVIVFAAAIVSISQNLLQGFFGTLPK